MTKLLATLLLVCGLQSFCHAQKDLGKGAYLCTSRRIEAWNIVTQKYDITSDWIILPAPLAAFRVMPDSIIYYADKQTDGVYKTQQIYKIEALKALPDIDSFADNEFQVTQGGLKSLITVRLLSGYEGYAGQIKVADGLVQGHFAWVITYTFTRSQENFRQF